MSKGWQRRPSAVDRKAWEAAFERIFETETGLSSMLPEVTPPFDTITVAPVPKHPDPCDIADTLTPYFDDQRSRA